MLLSRDDFRNAVFARDNNKCVFCDELAVDAHHIIERRLFKDGGYYVDNGASVCEFHHLECEKTNISVEEVREACNIYNVILPEHLYSDQIYDKWGNIILPDGMRLKGELFYDVSVQKILKDKLSLFIEKIKYPRTYHLPWSENLTSDDRMMPDISFFNGKRVIVTEKMDGENTSLYKKYFHARSVSSRSHESQNWVKQFWGNISFEIPDGWRICGENLYAKHSIKYEQLETYFMGFSIWNDKNICLSWDETLEWFELLDIKSVPVLYDGVFNESKIKALWSNSKWDIMEGYVIRVADSFDYKDFRNSVGKYVRKNHVQTIKHWKYGQQMEVNKLKGMN